MNTRILRNLSRIFVLTSGRWLSRSIAITYLPQSHQHWIHRFVAPVRYFLCLAAGLLLSLPPVSAQDDLVQRELQRRAQNTQEAQTALMEGDKAYRLANYEKAVDEFTKAFSLIPGGAGTAQLKAASADRLAQASVERAKELARLGDYKTAEALLETVLSDEVAPNYAPAVQMRAKLLDPIRNNPALSPQHARHVDQVRRNLYEAHSFADLGQYDRAMAMYQAVLRVDPHNSAARRGMEKVSALKSRYFDAARDEARAAMLTKVGKGWASPVPKPVIELRNDLGALKDGPLLGASASEKLDSLVLPVVDMDGVQLREAIDFLRQQSRTLDTYEPNPERKGVAFVIELGNSDPARTKQIESTPFDLKLRNVPLRKVLEYIMQATRTKARVDEHAVVIRPIGAVGNDLIFRQFKMPPDFLSREEIADGGDGAADPFTDDSPRRGLVKRLTAQEFLKQKGVDFPAGASATLSPQNGVLSVRNSQTNMALVEVIVEAIVEAEPVMIIVETRIIRSNLTRLEELGFDWLLGAQQVTDELFLGGGTVGNGTPIAASALRPVTAGNRSGNLATQGDPIQAAINRPPVQNSALRAPGNLTVTGLLNNSVIAALMRGVHQNKGIDLVTKKSVITRSGQAASIQSVREFIYPTEYEPPELPNSVGGNFQIDPLTGQVQGGGQSTFATPATPTAFETTNLGCTLDVLPQLGDKGQVIEVAIKPEIREFIGFINYGTPITGGSSNSNPGPLGLLTGGNFGVITENAILMPVISSLRGETTLSIIDGETVVLGGLLRSSQVKVQDASPIWSKIPLFGRLFASEADTSIKDAYIIMVTVRLQDPSGQPVTR